MGKQHIKKYGEGSGSPIHSPHLLIVSLRIYIIHTILFGFFRNFMASINARDKQGKLRKLCMPSFQQFCAH